MVKPGSDVAHDVEVERDLLPQARALHLYGHRLTPLEHALVHLAQRSGRDRLGVELLVDIEYCSAQVLFDAGHRQGGVEARQLVLQLGKFLQQQRRHDVGPGGEGLAGLDESGAERSH